MHSITENRVREILANLAGKKIAVIGDVMLDRYFWGSVNRISPEAPVPVIDIEKETFHLGGASNVAHNLKSLGIVPVLCGLIGIDNSGRTFREIAHDSLISTDGLFEDPSRPTIVKTRIIGNNQHIARLDRETREPVSPDGERHIFDTIKNISGLSGIIFEDYNKGVVTATLIKAIIDYANQYNIPVFVDPKFENFFAYRNVTVFKPNRKEARQALGLPMNTHEEVSFAGKKLLELLDSKYILLTLGADGMMLFERDGEVSSVPTKARHVADVSGAGDTTIAALSAAFSGGATMREAAAISNFAAGAVCEEPGIVPITVEKLITSVKKH